MRDPERARYFLVTSNAPDVIAMGMQAGDIIAVRAERAATVLREIALAPPLGIRARLEARGHFQPLHGEGVASAA
jgi:hypothetical protein